MNKPVTLPDGRNIVFIPVNIDSLDSVCEGCIFDSNISCMANHYDAGTCIDHDGIEGNDGIFVLAPNN